MDFDFFGLDARERGLGKLAGVVGPAPEDRGRHAEAGRDGSDDARARVIGREARDAIETIMVIQVQVSMVEKTRPRNSCETWRRSCEEFSTELTATAPRESADKERRGGEATAPD